MRTALLAVVTVASLAGEVRAQRGAAHISQETPPATPTSGFPGFLDTNTVGGGHVSAQLIGSVDWGVTDNLSVGVNAYGLLLNVRGLPTAMAQVRYRLHSGPRLASVVSAYGLYMQRDDLVAGGVVATSNTTYRLTSSMTATATVIAGWGSAEEDDVLTDSRQRDTWKGVVVGGSWGWAFRRRFELSLTLLTVAAGTHLEESVAQVSTQDLVGSSTIGELFFWRAFLDWRFREAWILGVGVMGTFGDPPIPLLSAGWRW